MNIHEYQAKELLAKFGVAVPKPAIAALSVERGRCAQPRLLPGPLVGGQVADPRRRARQGQVQ